MQAMKQHDINVNITKTILQIYSVFKVQLRLGITSKLTSKKISF